MEANGRTRDGQLALRKLADRQHGLLRHEQLVAAGLTRNQIAGWLRTSRLTRLHAGVYAYGHTAIRDEGRWLAAAWACGPGAVLSHLSAAAFHRAYREPADAPVHISTTRKVKSRKGIVVHRMRHLSPRDTFDSGPLTVTALPRTLVDIADVLTWSEFREVVDGLKWLDTDRLRGAQRRTPGRHGAPLVGRLLAADDAHTKSEFERRFLRFLAQQGLPRPDELNGRVAGHTADCIYRAQRLVIELDGRAYHQRRGQMRADRERDGDYQVAGFRILRLLWDDLHPDEATRTAERVRALLGR